MSSVKIVKYKCVDCGHTWVWFTASPENKQHVGCPACGGLYYQWLNHKGQLIADMAAELRASGTGIMYPNGKPTVA